MSKNISKYLRQEATLKIFAINHPDRIIERQLVWKLGVMGR